MSDIVERLRNWRTVHLTQLRYVMESAADEIERLRNGAVESRETVRDGRVVPTVTWFDKKIAEECRIAQAEIARLRLTDAERDALAAMVNRLCCEMTVVERDAMVGLLERLG
jgi:hypothetical protein